MLEQQRVGHLSTAFKRVIRRQTPRIDAVDIAPRRQRARTSTHGIGTIRWADEATIECMDDSVELLVTARHAGHDATTLGDELGQ